MAKRPQKVLSTDVVTGQRKMWPSVKAFCEYIAAKRPGTEFYTIHHNVKRFLGPKSSAYEIYGYELEYQNKEI